MLSRLKSLLPFSKSRPKGQGLFTSDYLAAAVANPKSFAQAVSRYLKRRQRMVEAVVRASESPILHEPRPKFPKSIDALLAKLSTEVAILELDRKQGAVTIGVNDLDAITATSFLAMFATGAVLTVDGKRANLGAEKIKAQILRAQTISVAFSDAHFDPIKVTLEIYREVEPGKWLSSNEKNTTLRAIYDDVFAKPQHVKAVDILGAPTLEARAEEAPIDAVYTWVNHDDPEWKANFQKWVNPTEPSDSVDDAGDANALSRFHNNDELRFSLRSIETNLPWLRHIYIFSNCAPPDWISTDHPRLSWVRHEQVMPADILPTFSSHVIESYLHRIPGLADKFIYLNDDFLVMRPMKKSDFFTESGMSLSRLEGYGMVSGPVRETDPDYLNAARNSAALVQQKFGFSPTRLHQHVPYALSRPVLEEIETSFQARIDAFRKNRFRKSNDLNIPSFLYHHYAIGSQRALLASAASIMVKSNDMLWERRLEQAQDRKYVFVCVNEGGADDAPSGWHAAIRQFLQRKFPQTAEWENPRP